VPRIAVDTRSLRESRDFRLLTLGSLVTGLGEQAALVALPYQVYVITRSPFLTGLLGLVELGPLVTASLWGGALADRFDRRRLLLACQIALVAVAAGLAAAALATVAPFTVWYADEARMYALFMLFAMLAAWAQVRVLRDERLRDCALYVAAAVALIYTQYFGLLFVGAQQLVFLGAVIARRRDRAALRAGLVTWGTFLCLMALAIVPLMSFAMGQFSANEAAGKGFHQPAQAGSSVAAAGGAAPGAYQALTNAVWAVFGYHSDPTMLSLAALWPLLMLLALLMLGRGRSWQSAALGVAAVLPAVALYGLGQLKPFVFEVRYFIGAVPLVLLLVARAVTSWPRRTLPMLLASGIATGALALGLADQQLNGSNPRVYDFKGALTALEQQAKPGDVVVYAPKYLDSVIAYYGRGKLDARPLGRGVPEPRKGHSVYVLGSFLNKPDAKAVVTKAVRDLDRKHRLVREENRPQIRIWEFR
jgi:hypothetical protein